MDDSQERITIKRVYEHADRADGVRVLVDRIWPRGMTKEKAALTAWMKDVAPSPGLRTWFGHQPGKFGQFAERYKAELSEPDARPHLEQLLRWADSGRVTLLYGARDERCNHAVVLRQFLEQLRGGPRESE